MSILEASKTSPEGVIREIRPAIRAATPVPQVKPARILMVEDDNDTRAGFRIRLSFEGYEVFSAIDGRNAVSLVQKISPDLVLLDLGLPGADGLEVLGILQSIRPNLPVIVISAWEEARYESKCLDRGAWMFLQKPVAGEQLVAAVRSVLDR